MASLVENIRKLLLPPTADSWKSLVWISVFSWLVALLAGDVVSTLIAICGWCFLIPGIHWGLYKEAVFKQGLTIAGFFLGPWITGFLICYFIFGTFFGGFSPLALACWPPVSAIVAVLPLFIQHGPKFTWPKPEKRPKIVILLAANLLISCWIQLYFLVQFWLTLYPSFLADSFGQSQFVFRWSEPNLSQLRGKALLQRVAPQVEAALADQPWAATEKWLTDLETQTTTLQQALPDWPELPEDEFWQLRLVTVPQSEYDLMLQSIWRGPTQTGGYYFTQVCNVRRSLPSSVPPAPATTPDTPTPPPAPAPPLNTQIVCNPARGPLPLQANAPAPDAPAG